MRAALPRIHVSTNHRFLTTKTGAPFFWLGDTAWELFHRTNREEALRYLDNRQRNGFTVIQAVALAECDGLNTPNCYGHRPLEENDSTRPVDAYFQYIDDLIELAAQRQLYIGLLPTFGDKVAQVWGIGPQIFTPENAYAFGEYLGRRYRDATNVIWVNGGDRPPIKDGIDYSPVWRSMAEGIKAGVGEHTLMTYHPSGQSSSSEAFHHDNWLDFNMWQSGHMTPDWPIWDSITADYERRPMKPVLDGEPNYEDHPINPFTRKWLPEYGYFRDYDVRKQAYRSVFAGACGITYGHHSVWQMYTAEREPINFPDCDWYTAIERPGAAQMIHLRRLVESRPYFSRIPDQTMLVSDEGEGAAHIRTTRDAEGHYALIYLPLAAQIVTIDLQTLAGQEINAWWYDPRTGASTHIDTLTGQPTVRFTSPTEGPDWVLVLDDAAAGFGVPGVVV